MKKFTIRREQNYTKSDRKRAMKSKFGKLVLDGTPTVFDPMSHMRGTIYFLWLRWFGLTIEYQRLFATPACLKRFGIEA